MLVWCKNYYYPLLLAGISLSSVGFTPLGSLSLATIFVLVVIGATYYVHSTVRNMVSRINSLIRNGKISYSPSLQKCLRNSALVHLYGIILSVVFGLSGWSFALLLRTPLEKAIVILASVTSSLLIGYLISRWPSRCVK